MPSFKTSTLPLILAAVTLLHFGEAIPRRMGGASTSPRRCPVTSASSMEQFQGRADARARQASRGLKLSADGKRLYVALSGSPIAAPGVDESTLPPADKEADGIGVVDLEQRRIMRVIKGVSDPEQVALSADEKRMYVASEDTGTAVVIDVPTGKTLATITVGGEPEGVEVSRMESWCMSRPRRTTRSQ